MDTLAWDLAPRIATSTDDTSSSSAGSPSPATSPALGQLARWMEPSFHQDQTSSVTYGMIGASSRSTTSKVSPSVARADALAEPWAPYARSLTSSR